MDPRALLPLLLAMAACLAAPLAVVGQEARGCMGCCVEAMQSGTFNSNAPTLWNPDPKEPEPIHVSCAQVVRQYFSCLQRSCLTPNYAAQCPHKDRGALNRPASSVGFDPVPVHEPSPDQRIWQQPVQAQISRASFLPLYLFNGPLATSFPPPDSHSDPKAGVPPCGHKDPAARKCWRDYMRCVWGEEVLDDGQRAEGWLPPSYHSCDSCVSRFEACVDAQSPCTAAEQRRFVQWPAEAEIEERQLLNFHTHNVDRPQTIQELEEQQEQQQQQAEPHAAHSSKREREHHPHRDEL